MSSVDGSDITRQSVFTLRIIVLALCFGVISFGLVTIFMKGTPPPAQAAAEGGGVLNPIVLVAVVLAVTSLTLGFVLPQILDRSTRRGLIDGAWKSTPVSNGKFQSPTMCQSEDEFLARAYTTRTIITGALAEGAAFFSLVGVVVTKTTWLYALALVLITRIVMLVPTEFKLTSWMDGQKQKAKEESVLDF